MTIFIILLMIVCAYLYSVLSEAVKEINKINKAHSAIVDYNYRLFCEVSELKNDTVENFENVEKYSKEIDSKIYLLEEGLKSLKK